MISHLKRILPVLLLGLVPLMLLLGWYLYSDPFMVVHKYRDFSNSFVIPNRDYVSTEMYRINRSERHINSFIFGSSRALAFRPMIWRKYLDEAAVPFIYDASGESVYGIVAKLRYIEESGGDISNALILLCRDGAFDSMGNPSEHLSIKHPAISKESALYFQFVFFRAFLNIKFLVSHLVYSIDGEFRPFMNGLIEKRKITINPEDNSLVIIDQEKEINEFSEVYYRKRRAIFHTMRRERRDTVQRITDEYLRQLVEMKEILSRHQTDYRIVLTPIYDQVRFNDRDMVVLQQLFGQQLWDFTGRNWITDDISNWYEPYHFRPFVADSIMSVVYSAKRGN
jgi:hypothetical protein